MESSRLRTAGHGTTGTSIQPRRAGANVNTPQSDFTPSLSRRARKAAENAALSPQDVPSSRNATKIPLTSTLRTSAQTHGRKPSLHGHFWGSNSSNGSEDALSSVASSSGPSSRSQESSKQPRNVLRRKHPRVTPEPTSMPYHSRNSSLMTDSTSSVPRSNVSLDIPQDANMDRKFTPSPADLQPQDMSETPATNTQPATVYPELDRYRDYEPQEAYRNYYAEVPYPISTDLPPPTPLFSSTSSQHSAFSGSPSTRFSGSPGGGPYSRDTTPTSMSSQSPGLVVPMRLPVSRSKQSSPADTRPPVTRRRAGSASKDVRDDYTEPEGLSMVRESVNSSSSASTVREATLREQRQKRLISSRAPSPPPRVSSDRFKKTRDREAAPTRTSHAPSKSVPVIPSAARVTNDARQFGEASGAPTPRPTPPMRPSREGTPDLHSQVGLPVPVVHSNLSSTQLSERRRSLNPPINTATSSRSNTPLQGDRQHQAPGPRIGREATPAPQGAGLGPSAQATKSDPRKPPRTPSPSVSSTFKSRFPLFSRKNKSISEAPPSNASERKDRPARKGPAAGTGHEGYGRLGHVRRRSGSMTNNPRSIPGTMSSQESLASSQSVDPFLAERMSPVVIAGGEIIENRNVSFDASRTGSEQNLALPRPSLGSRNNSGLSSSSQDDRNTLWPSAMPHLPGPSMGPRRPSESSDSEALHMKPTLALRRSIQRLQNADQGSMRLPQPIVIRSGVTTPSMKSHDTSILSDDSLYDPRRMQGPAKIDAAHPPPKKLLKKPKSPRKWNLFGRSTTHPSSKTKEPEKPKPVAAPASGQKKSVAFYTMMDASEQELEVLPDVKQVLREAQSPTLPSPAPQAPNQEIHPALRDQHRTDRMKPAQAKTPRAPQVSKSIPPAAAKVEPRKVPTQPARTAPASTAPASTSKPSASKPPTTRSNRLPQVGRIPKVANSRTEPNKSFSRPFNRNSIQQQPQAEVQDSAAEFVAKGPSPPRSLTSASDSKTEEQKTVRTEKNAPSSAYRLSRDVPSEASRSQNEFLSFPPRKDSEGTSTTSSSCSGMLSYSDATAVIPGPNAPLAEDEVWDEYNDLMGEDGLKVPPSAGSSQGKPFHLEMWGRQLANDKNTQLESPTIDAYVESDCETEFEAEAQEEPAPMSSSGYSSGLTAKIDETLESIGGQTASFSMSDFVSGYGDRNNSLNSQSQLQRTSTASSQKARVIRDSHASGSSQGSDDNSAVSQVNLRVGSMTVSKWLTFGHVLFSPVRDELIPMTGSLKRHSILVIDGLGNDDWSFYAAETYPAATFFNLSPRSPLPTESQAPSSGAPLSPPNHHQIQYKSHMDRFPFGSQSFTSVVYRFPSAVPESHYRNIVSEARRVLKPGGYMELSILDIDLNNMGNRGRRAVRQLKERVHIRSPNVSLASSSDLLLRLLGRKGFTDIKTCRLGVPVASALAPSESSTSGSSRTGSKSGPARSTSGKAKRDTRSLAEIISDDGPIADESITKMVAKVGRWWYDRCYESVAPAPGGRSMWSDPALLAECEEWRTTLKLMVCHARMPEARGRLASI
ncbi:hypothetical protein KVR01_010520 [Diaporthe batatas]|uniref:uncharacterized protein n=1 Tax=Diaporthe batatas TaxID=748121 RepID=UPI001D04FF97|nr:uncharacterized protein KVR01_010520 [Diaporthe batatas]KAG8159883.1 hypothetical protein KVR01_010520 [Diaporthe batatas]